jgi:hypothetical protein
MDLKITFFCELEAKELQHLFSDERVIEDVSTLGASINMGILDLSPERAEVVRKLNEAEIPTVGWLLLPKEEGYWFNLNNGPQAVARYADFKMWSSENKLQWDGIGIDVEPDLRELQGLVQGRMTPLRSVLKRLVNVRAVRDARTTYWNLVYQIRMDGYRVDSYHFPFIVDERKVGAALIQRLAGLFDIPSDREVLMLYTTWFRPHGPGILWSYAPDAESVGLGVTGGGVELEGLGEIRPLDWVEFSRDLRLASRHTDDIHIFSLEGCVQQGFMERLKSFEWAGPVSLPLEQARRANVVRKILQWVLWGSAHPFLVLAGLIGLKWIFSRLLQRKDG